MMWESLYRTIMVSTFDQFEVPKLHNEEVRSSTVVQVQFRAFYLTDHILFLTKTIKTKPKSDVDASHDDQPQKTAADRNQALNGFEFCYLLITKMLRTYSRANTIENNLLGLSLTPPCLLKHVNMSIDFAQWLHHYPY